MPTLNEKAIIIGEWFNKLPIHQMDFIAVKTMMMFNTQMNISIIEKTPLVKINNLLKNPEVANIDLLIDCIGAAVKIDKEKDEFVQQNIGLPHEMIDTYIKGWNEEEKLNNFFDELKEIEKDWWDISDNLFIN